MKRVLVWGVAATLVGVAGAELVARFALGLGDPPLYALDPKIEYLLAPSQDRRPLGNRFTVNSRSMRSAEFPAEKSSPEEFRVLVLGDSIVNGGVKVDQSQLATERLQSLLSDKLKRPVIVGNASAGSWGPPNELAYVEHFGLMQADVLVLVLNSGDVDDVPGLEAIGPQWPRSTPALALLELGERKLPTILGRVTGNAASGGPAHTPDPTADAAAVRRAISGLSELARSKGTRAVVVLAWSRDELERGQDARLDALRRAAGDAGMPVIDTRERFAGRPELLQPDGVHPTPQGQAALAEVLQAAVERAVQTSP